MTWMADNTSLLSAVEQFAQDEIAPAAAGWSFGAAPDAALFSRAADLGLTALELPETRGGKGADFRTKARVCETLAAADFGFAMSLVNTHNVALRLCLSASKAVQDRYVSRLISGQAHACTALTEPGAGSDLAMLKTTATRDGDGWRLSGQKTWLINGRRADVAIVFAQCGSPGDLGGIGAFAVDCTAPGVQRDAIDSGFSQTSLGTGGLVFDAVTLSPDDLILPPGTAFRSIMAEINAARTYVAAMCNGILQAALAEAAHYGARRIVFGKPLAEHPDWAGLLDRADDAWRNARELTERAVSVVVAGEDAQRIAAEAKVLSVETCQKHLPDLLQAMGAEGLRPNRCFTRHLAAAQIAGLTDGATNLLKGRIARLGLKTP